MCVCVCVCVCALLLCIIIDLIFFIHSHVLFFYTFGLFLLLSSPSYFSFLTYVFCFLLLSPPPLSPRLFFFLCPSPSLPHIIITTTHHKHHTALLTRLPTSSHPYCVHLSNASVNQYLHSFIPYTVLLTRDESDSGGAVSPPLYQDLRVVIPAAVVVVIVIEVVMAVVCVFRRRSECGGGFFSAT